MSNIKLDLSKFKHVSSDKNSTKLRHADGHFLVLAHKKLGSDNQKQLSALSKIGPDAQTADQANQQQDMNRYNKMAEGGQPQPIDKQKAQDVAKGADHGETMSDGFQNMKNELGIGQFQPTVSMPKKAEGGKVQEDGQKAWTQTYKSELDKRNHLPGAQAVKEAMDVAHSKHGKFGVQAKYSQGGGIQLPDQLPSDGHQPSRQEQVDNDNQRADDAEASEKETDLYSGSQGVRRTISDAATGNLAQGGKIQRYAEGSVDRVHAPDNYGRPPVEEGPPGYDNSTAPALDPGEPVQSAPQQAPAEEPGLSEHIGNLIGKFGTKAVVKHMAPYVSAVKLGAAGASKVIDEGGKFINGMSKGANAELPPELGAQPQQASMEQPEGVAPEQPQDQAPAQAPQAAAPADPNGMPDYDTLINRGYGQQQQALHDTGEAQAALGQAQEEALKARAIKQQDAQDFFKSQYLDLNKERQAHIADVQNGYIDPNKYWTGDANGNGSHSKIAAGIGMIIAGFNPSSKPNAAIDFLKHQMEMNIEGQKANLGAKQNLLNANLRQFGNLKDATDMTRLMQADLMQNELAQAAAKAQTPLAKAAALAAQGKLNQDYAPLAMQVSMRQSMMKYANGNAGNDPSDTTGMEHLIMMQKMYGDPEKAKDMEQHLVPGVGSNYGKGQAITDADRHELISHAKLENAAKDLQQFVGTHTTMVPGTPAYTIGAQKAAIVQQMIREGMLGTVYREGEKPLLDKMLKSNPANFMKAFNTEPQLKQLLESNTAQANILKRSYNLPIAQSQQQNPNEGKTGKLKDGTRVKMVNGSWTKI